MIEIKFLAEGEGAWPDLQGKEVGHTSHLQVVGLPRGMASGAASVALRHDLPDGRVVIAETSLALFLAAADALKARFGDPRETS